MLLCELEESPAFHVGSFIQLSNSCWTARWDQGGAAVGPAGSGKTETIREMGHILGRHVIIFNCNDRLRHQNFSSILKGLSQSGAWGCFDQFNNIKQLVMSVISQQVLSESGKDHRHSSISWIEAHRRLNRPENIMSGSRNAHSAFQ